MSQCPMCQSPYKSYDEPFGTLMQARCRGCGACYSYPRPDEDEPADDEDTTDAAE